MKSLLETFGEGVEEFQYFLSMRRKGWRSLKEETTWSPHDLLEFVIAHWRAFHEHNHRLLVTIPCGIRLNRASKPLKSCYSILELPELPVPCIAEFSKVGTSAEYEGTDNWKKVQDGLNAIFEIRKFEIILAGRARLDAVFCDTVSLEDSKSILGILLEICPTAPLAYDDFDLTKKQIVDDNGFKLQWHSH